MAPVNSAGFRPRDVPALVRAMYFSGPNWPAALLALSLAEVTQEALVNRYGWNSPNSAMNRSAWVHAVFNRFEPGDAQFPTHASMRAERRFEGATLVVPLAYLEDVELPVDWPGGFTDSERDSGQWVVAGDPIDVGLPVSGPPVVARRFVPMLAAARESELTEVAVRVRYL
ncbi:MAG TPA: hypothetical protein VHP33_09095 [Polyangiaceae bacterium]|nr:hypothetical protein [Polyangiaceae bacterium]